MKRLLLTLIEGYQRWISPLHPPCCRYIPSCSAYAKQAISRFGALKGGLLALWRIMRCNPFSRGGYDPVPEEFRFGPRRHASGMDKDGADRIQSEEEKEEYKQVQAGQMAVYQAQMLDYALRHNHRMKGGDG